MTAELRLACERAIHVITADGETLRAGRAAMFILERTGWKHFARVMRWPPMIWFVELGYYNDALLEYQKALDINRYSSLAHYRIGEVFFLQNNYQSAANEFRESINGDQVPEWTIVWAHINLGKIFDVTGQRDRAVNEYQLAIRTRDNTQNAQDEARKFLESPYVRPRRQERVF